MKGQTVLITGGTGTFGTAFISYALKNSVRRLIVLSRGEHRQAELVQRFNDPRIETWLGDVRDRERVRKAMRVRPDIVLHAAALKRVESCEKDPEEAHKTNVIGTINVCNEATEHDVSKVLLISSDKACSPETVYGATKAEAEAQAIALNGLRGLSPTRISVVRYGNVLGSQGSFFEVLLRARQTGEPVYITDREATRFWWSADEAVRFVGSVLDRMRGAEIWVPKLGNSRLIDLARAVANRSEMRDATPRASEKRHEVMISATEVSNTWELPDCFVILPRAGQWWSPAQPDGAVMVPPSFAYRSDINPQHVKFEEEQCASA